MKRLEVKTHIADLLRNASTLATRLKRLQLSPLSGILLAALSTMTLGMTLFAAYAIFGPAGSESGAAAPNWTPPTLAVVELDPPKPASADVETLSRPIFTKNRKPSPKAPPAPTDTTNISSAPNGMTVTAIVKNRKVTQAFLISSDSPEGAWRKVGDVVDSWTVTSIAQAEVILQNSGQTTKVKLYADPPGAESAPGPGGAPPFLK